MKSEIRKDYIQDKYVIIAPRRGKRPHDVAHAKKSAGSHTPHLPCPFCPDQLKNVAASLTVGGEKNWKLKVIPNIFPAVSLDNPKAYGIQEVVVETPDPHEQLEHMDETHIALLLTAYQKRTREIMKNKNIEYILIFKNDGGKAGASLQHAHSQIFATKFLPPHLLDKSQKTQEYKLQHGTCVYCDVIKKEEKGPRLVYADTQVVAFCPYASIHNYEIWVMPRAHRDNIMLLNDKEKASFAKILKKILHKIGDLGLPYNYYFHQVVHDLDQHLYMKITPRGSVWAGVEIGSGLIINPIRPSSAAAYYRS